MIPSNAEHSQFPHIQHSPAPFLFRVPPETGARGQKTLAFTINKIKLKLNNNLY